MKIIIILIIALFPFLSEAQIKTVELSSFDKVIVSPHIEVILKEGNNEKVEINDIFQPIEKLNVKIEGRKTLRIYLDDAKVITKYKKSSNQYNQKTPVYKGTQAIVTIYYKKLKKLSIRGEENIVFASPIVQKKLKLKAFGESNVQFNEVKLERLKAIFYGESLIKIAKGTIKNQRYTNYGEGNYKLNVDNYLKIVAYGTTRITYKGEVKNYNGMLIGESIIKHIN